jgi:hypothetical protein
VVLAWRKLRHYFEAHPVTVVSSFLLGEIIRNPDAAGRIAKWSVELMGETLAYAPRKAKSQILADFVAEWTNTQLPPPQIQVQCWTLKGTDGRDPPQLRQPGARTCVIITARQLKSRGGPSHPPAHVAHYVRGRGA